MKILFLGLASTYTPGMAYQDNELCRQTVADGHQVTYISNPEKFVDGVIVDTEPEDVVLPDGLHLIRLPYCKVGPTFITKKIRKFKGVYEILEQEKPDVIFSHNTQYWSILDVIRYKKKHPEVKFYADTHTDEKNSGTNWLSLHVLHRIFYRFLLQQALPYLDKYFYVTTERKAFALQHYGAPESKMEFYPLGGKITSEEDYSEKRKAYREHLNATDADTVFVHSGKLDALKRTEELLQAFSAVDNPNAKLVIIGSMPEERKTVLIPLIEKDPRIVFLGWQTAEELTNYLCACDMYLQPGSQSATLESALCCGCAVMSYPHEAYTAEYGNSGMLWCETQEDMQEIFRDIADKKTSLQVLKEQALSFAKRVLDYEKLAQRLYQ